MEHFTRPLTDKNKHCAAAATVWLGEGLSMLFAHLPILQCTILCQIHL